ncbi:MAG TPA: hypothetical protein PKE64_11950 [Anaerolineae bacterium]|nr:hypothetical protein [Anaerolineae bacterium]HMR64711.1 hypothetical protein [Anaerolineae bacterium]
MNCTQEIFGLWLIQLIVLTVMLPPQITLWLVVAIKLSDLIKRNKERKSMRQNGLWRRNLSQAESRLSPYENWLEELEDEGKIPFFRFGHSQQKVGAK